MSPDEQTSMVLQHVDRMAAMTQETVRAGFSAIHKRLDVQDEVQRDHGKRLARIEGGDAARAAIQLHSVTKPSPKRMPRWQRVVLSFVGWGSAVATAAVGGWKSVQAMLGKG